ncbi:MAG: hypothetical protein JNK82_02355 [Myxococcaceae bacterium]|nr:hypothetical protein [Myxococcaceae bacterium]
MSFGFSRARLALLAVLSLAGCPDDRIRPMGGCQQDSDCGDVVSAWRCEPQTGECYCRTDEACPARKFCNPTGFCQDKAGCASNTDCGDPSLFCDTTTATCLSRGRCSTDLHCTQGNICDLSRNVCVEGCRSNGDCPGSSCRCGDVPCNCTATTPADLQRCQVGVCDPTFCSDRSFCRYGELCGIPPDAGVQRNQCYSDFDVDVRPYCAGCLSGGGIDTCGRGANYCIIDTRTNATYCGADCSAGQACPRGYGCRDIRVVFSRWQCGPGLPPCAPNPSLVCATDADCERGGACVKAPGAAMGACAGRCRLREGSDFGYCSCQVDFDCAPQSCSGGECTISRQRCVTEQDCRAIRCVDFDGIGGCLIGQNCTPDNGLTCIEVGQ